MLHLKLLVLLLLVLVLSSIPCFAQVPDATPVSVAPTDSNILYIGRWDRTDPAHYHSYWGGAYMRVLFTGTSVAINLSERTGLIVSIDGEAFREDDGGGSGPFLLNSAPLKPGTHSMLVGSSGQNYEISFQGLVLDAGAATVAAVSAKPLIEFIGDSITALTGSPGGSVNWAWNAAEALGCNHTQIAFSGRALTTGYGCAQDKTAMDTQYFCLKNFNHLTDNPQPLWNFSYTPDIIVINLGQNDQCGQEPAATMYSSYSSFLHKLRLKFPMAQIVALRPFGGAYATSIRQAVHDMIASGDTRVQFVDTTGWLEAPDFVDGIHPNGIGNLKVTGRLVPILRTCLPQH